MTDILDKLRVSAEEIEEKLDALLPTEREGRIGENRLSRAMRYSVMSPGKRLRPFLVMASSSLFGVGKDSALQVAASIEFIHAYSLIHDDLPALDDDDLRRGRPSCHKEFDEATAILAGDALLTFAFEVLSHPSTHSDGGVRAELVQCVAKACGASGMVGGQMIDLLSGERELNIEQITRLQRLKTGALFAISCEAGAILGKAAIQPRNALRGYANDMGLAYQITDDLLDAEAREGRQNKSEEKGTYVSIMGVEKARMQAELLTTQAIAHLHVFDKKADPLRDLARHMFERKN